MRFARVAAVLTVAMGIVLGWIWLRAGIDRPLERPSIPASSPSPPAVVAARPAPSGPDAFEGSGAGAPLLAAEAPPSLPDPSGDLALYADHPMSDVPHRVVRGWGLGPRSPRPGTIGALVVVDPAIGSAALKDLVRDIRAYHRGADALAVRVLDSLHAATYNRHEDGGALLAESVVATIHYNEQLELDETKVHGEPIDPESEMAAEAGGAEAAGGEAVAAAGGEDASGNAPNDEGATASGNGASDAGNEAGPSVAEADSGLAAGEERPQTSDAPDEAREESEAATPDPV